MNKKIILICIILILLILIFSVFLYHKSCNYEDLLVSDETWNEIISKRTMTNENFTTSLKFNDYELLFDNVNCTYYYSLIESYSNRYNPTVSYKTNKDDLKLVINKKITDNLIENNDCVEIMLYNDTEFTIYALRCTTLPILNITSNDIDNLSRTSDINMSLYLFDNSKKSAKRITRSDGKMHIRGQISAVFPKKCFKLSLKMESLGNHTRKNHLSLLGMRKDDDWILYAAYNDQEKIRNVFASNLWYEASAKNNMFGITNGNQYKFLELFINNEYWGLYALGYRIDEKQLNIDNNQEYLFSKNQYDETESHVLEYKENKLPNYELRNEAKDEATGWQYLKNYYVTLLQSKNVDELYNISDINNVIDYYLFQEFIQGNDNAKADVLKNVFISIKKHNNKNVFIYTPWDYDLSMGNVYNETSKNFTNEYAVAVDETINFKLNAIGALKNLNDTKINDLVKNRYKELRNTYYSESHLKELISNYSKQIYDSGAFNRDKTRWVDSNYNDEEEKLTKFEEYVLERLKATDKFIDSNF